MRINKLFSNLGICSRRDTNRLIEEGRVTVNGEPCRLGQWVEESDEILIDNKSVEQKKRIYIVLNKPIGITCTAEEGVKNNIIEYMNFNQYIFPVGRLDKASQGLILMTNDGDLANKILESDNEHEKEYIVTLNRDYNKEFLDSMSKGVKILDVVTRPCKVFRVNNNTFKIILTQGLNKQIRRMSLALGYKVIRLERVRIMNLKLDNLEVGKWRYLSNEELIELKSSCK